MSRRPAHHRWTSAGAGLVLVATGAVLAIPAPAAHALAVRADLASLPYAVSSGLAHAVQPMASAQKLRLVISLRPRDPQGEASFLAALQDRRSPQFHHYLSAAQWAARFAPSAAAEAAVVAWARGAGLTVTQRYSNRLLVDVEGTVATIEHAFAVHIDQYDANGARAYSNDIPPLIPASISAVVQSVQGLDDIQRMQPSSPVAQAHPVANVVYSAGPTEAGGASGHADGSRVALQAALARSETKARERAANPSITGGAYDPTDIYLSEAYDYRALYNQGHCCNPSHHANSSSPQGSIAIVTVGSQAGSDITSFHNNYPYLAYNYSEVNVDGTPPAGDGEGTMDAEWATATANSFGAAADTAHVYLYDGVNNSGQTFLDMYERVLSDSTTRVMTVSWGCAEIYCATASAIESQHTVFDALIAQGWTLVAISGDHGAYADCVHRSVMYPGSDPDVVSAGGTELSLSQGSVYQSETAWSGGPADCIRNDGGSGGGCSAVFGPPVRQSSPSTAPFPRPCLGRSVPDLALNADWYHTPQNMVFGGQLFGNGGTSMVAPELAGFFAQEDAYLLALGVGPLGQADPILRDAGNHDTPHDPFYDITSGCNTNDVGPGYCATAGVDEVTGLGSVNMLQLAWAINFEVFREGPPSVVFTGPPTGNWYYADQNVAWIVTEPASQVPVDIAGYDFTWDTAIGDPTNHATPGTGDPFYLGPERPTATTGSLSTASLAPGCHTVHVLPWNNEGWRPNNGDQTYGPVCIDRKAPTVTAGPWASLVTGSKVGASTVPVKIAWSATDDKSGVASYTLQRSTDGGAFSHVTLTSPTATSYTDTLTTGHNYRYEVSATDKAGNTTPFVAGSAFGVHLVQENAGVMYSAGWSRQAVSGASGGDVEFATTKSRTARYTFTGGAIAWVSTRGSNRGAASVAVDGTSYGKTDTHGTNTVPAVMVFAKSLIAGAHTITLTTAGTSGRPRVDVDAFVYLG